MKSHFPRLLGGLVALGLLHGAAHASTTDWTAQLTINAPGAGSQQLVIGTSATGKDGFSGVEDTLAPPAPPLTGSPTTAIGVQHTTAGGFPFAGLYSADIRAPIAGGQSKTWNPIAAKTTIDLSQGSQVQINWTLKGVPDNITLQFQELNAAGAVSDTNGDGLSTYDMKKAASYSYTQTAPSDLRFFQVVATNTSPVVGLMGVVTEQNLTPNGVTLVFTTDRPANATVAVTPAAGGATTTFTSPDFVTQHSVQVTGLNPNASYQLVVTAASNQPGVDALLLPAIAIQTLTQPIQFSNLTAMPTTTDATITWSTDLASNSEVDYGATAAYGMKVTDAGLVTSHSLKVTGLTPDTTYHYRIISAIPGQGSATSGDQTFHTPAISIQITQPPAVTNLTFSGATITWTTDLASDSTVNYGPTTAYGQTAVVAALATQHSVTLANLKPATTYHYQVISSAAGHPAVTSADQTFQTPSGKIQITLGPAIASRTGSSATLVYDTSVPTDTVVHFGTGATLSQTQTGAGNTTHHVVTLTGLSPTTGYSFQVVANTTGFDTLTSAPVTFTTLGLDQDFAFVDAYNVLDVANDPTGQIVNQTSPLFGATTGAERGVAYDAKRGILYIARGTMTNEDGRMTGQNGVAAIRLTPLNKSANPNMPDATSNYTDSGLIVAGGVTGLGFVQSLAYDPVSDALYVFSGPPGSGPSKTPEVFTAPGGTLGGASNGGDPSRANPALLPLFTVSEPVDSSGNLLGGNNRGIAVRTAGGVTTLYLAMAQHADVWSNAGGTWSRAWSSDLFPADTVADPPLHASDTAIRSVAVDDAGNSYWPVSAATAAPRIWVFPASASGTGVGFNDAAFNGTHKGLGRPLTIDNDGTLIPPTNFTFPVNAVFVREGTAGTLFTSELGADEATPSVARLLLTGDPSGAGNTVTARLVDAFGPGATGAVQDRPLASMAVKGPAGKTQPSEPPASAKLLYFAVSPDEHTLYLNTFVKNDQAGQSLPTSGIAKVSYSGLPTRPFIATRPVATANGTSVTITWSTDIATTNNTVEYGPTTAYGQVAMEAPVDGGSQNHSVTITGLTAGSTYHFRVTSGGGGIQTVDSADATFTTGVTVVLGDLNGDGMVDLKDTTLSLQFAINARTPSADQSIAGDVNHDGVLDLKDTTLILEAAIKLIVLK